MIIMIRNTSKVELDFRMCQNKLAIHSILLLSFLCPFPAFSANTCDNPSYVRVLLSPEKYGEKLKEGLSKAFKELNQSEKNWKWTLDYENNNKKCTKKKINQLLDRREKLKKRFERTKRQRDSLESEVIKEAFSKSAGVEQKKFSRTWINPQIIKVNEDKEKKLKKINDWYTKERKKQDSKLGSLTRSMWSQCPVSLPAVLLDKAPDKLQLGDPVPGELKGDFEITNTKFSNVKQNCNIPRRPGICKVKLEMTEFELNVDKSFTSNDKKTKLKVPLNAHTVKPIPIEFELENGLKFKKGSVKVGIPRNSLNVHLGKGDERISNEIMGSFIKEVKAYPGFPKQGSDEEKKKFTLRIVKNKKKFNALFSKAIKDKKIGKGWDQYESENIKRGLASYISYVGSVVIDNPSKFSGELGNLINSGEKEAENFLKNVIVPRYVLPNVEDSLERGLESKEEPREAVEIYIPRVNDIVHRSFLEKNLNGFIGGLDQLENGKSKKIPGLSKKYINTLSQTTDPKVLDYVSIMKLKVGVLKKMEIPTLTKEIKKLENQFAQIEAKIKNNIKSYGQLSQKITFLVNDISYNKESQNYELLLKSCPKNYGFPKGSKLGKPAESCYKKNDFGIQVPIDSINNMAASFHETRHYDFCTKPTGSLISCLNENRVTQTPFLDVSSGKTVIQMNGIKPEQSLESVIKPVAGGFDMDSSIHFPMVRSGKGYLNVRDVSLNQKFLTPIKSTKDVFKFVTQAALAIAELPIWASVKIIKTGAQTKKLVDKEGEFASYINGALENLAYIKEIKPSKDGKSVTIYGDFNDPKKKPNMKKNLKYKGDYLSECTAPKKSNTQSPPAGFDQGNWGAD